MNVLAEDGSAWRHEFANRARPFSVRWRRRRLLARALTTLPLLLLATGALLALNRFTLIDLPEPTGELWFPLVLWLGLLLGSYLVDRPPLGRLARAIDQHLDLDERLGTAVALSHAPLPADGAARLIGRQRVDALDILADRGGDGAKDFRPAMPRRRPALVLAGLLALALIPLSLVPSPVAGQRDERAAVRAAAAAQAARLGQVRRETVPRPELPAAARDVVDTQLTAAETALRDHPADRAADVAALSQAEEKIRALLPDNAAQQTAARKSAARALQALFSNGAEVSDPSETDLERAATLATQAQEQFVTNPGASGTNQLALAGSLERLATALDASDPALAAALRSAAGALRANKNTDAALQQLANTLRETSRSQAATDLLTQALAQVSDSKQAVAQAGLPAVAAGDPNSAARPFGRLNTAPARAADLTPGPASAQGAGGDDGAGAGQDAAGRPADTAGDGQPGAGSSASAGRPSNSALGDNLRGGVGTTNGSAGQGGNGSGRVAGTGNTPGTAGSGALEQVYVPEDALPQTANGPQDRIPGVESPDQGGSQETSVVRSGPGTNPGVKTPYNKVIGKYQDTAAQALDHTYIPADAKQYVRDYFNSLAPTP
jgi:hypothetical protein